MIHTHYILRSPCTSPRICTVQRFRSSCTSILTIYIEMLSLIFSKLIYWWILATLSHVWGASDKYPQHMFRQRNKMFNMFSCKECPILSGGLWLRHSLDFSLTLFWDIVESIGGIQIHRCVLRDELNLSFMRCQALFSQKKKKNNCLLLLWLAF